MKKKGKWFLSAVSKALFLVIVILILPYARILFRALLPDTTGEIRLQSQVLKQKLESSKRLEVTRVDEEGILNADTTVIIFGTVGSTRIRYRYTASVGIDLAEVMMTEDSDRIIFTLPDPQVMNDGIEALEIERNNFFSKAIDRSVESLLSEQRLKCREQYISEERYSEQTWQDMVRAFNDTICRWLDTYGERHYEFEFRRTDDETAST